MSTVETEYPDVVWNSPSEDCHGSMPLGNGEVGVNAWGERNGDLVLFIARTDAFDQACRLLKLGRLRVRLTPNPLAGCLDFQQRLRLCDATLIVTGGGVEIRVFADACHPAVRVEIDSENPVECKV